MAVGGHAVAQPPPVRDLLGEDADLARFGRPKLEREAVEQQQLQTTADWIEGVRASMERRTPNFLGQ